MEQLKRFNVEKAAALDTLNKLGHILDELNDIGIDVSDDLQKIASSIKAIDSDVLRIALLGAFSDGKTSVIASWLGKVMDDMKIDMDESSDQLTIYKPDGFPDKCEIVDTPGLFGDKEKTVDGSQVMYEDITKRYISEAHLTLYVVDATNPLKESHSTIAKWILRDLNKLSSTVFVINKMDEVTDLTEQALFDEQAAIKKENLKSKLQRAANLTPAELAMLNIVCIASNPNGRGLEYWFGKPVHYESRSRINDLKEMTSRIIKTNVPEMLIAKTGLDVVRDIVGKKLSLARTQLNELESFARQNQVESSRIKEDIQRGRAEVKRLAGELFNELQNIENQMLGRLRSISLEEIHSFLDEEIGYTDEGVGYKMHLKIKTTIDRFFDMSSAVTSQISLDISRQLDSGESFLNAMGEKAISSIGGALKSVSQLNPAVIKSTIFAARDVLGQVTGVAVKFKPWEATKLAGSISKWAGPAGAAFSLGTDIYKAYKANELEQQLKEVKDDISKIIKDAFKNIYEILAQDERIFEFFAPDLKRFEQIVLEMSKGSEKIQINKQKISRIQDELSSLTLPGIERSESPPFS